MRVCIARFVRVASVAMVFAAVATLAWQAADAQPPAKQARVGYLRPQSTGPRDAAFRQALRDLGWVEGQNLVIDFRIAGPGYDRLAALAAELVQRKVDVIFAATAPAALAAKQATAEIPVVFEMYPHVVMAEAGGLITYAPSSVEMYRRAAGQVDRILRGAKPGDLPVEQPTKFEMIVNMKTAKRLGLVIPQALLLRADRIIE